jgi:flagellum-specific peptidoglycan hydrolase FlgJ
MLSMPAFSKANKTPQQVYIERYSSLAVEEMYRSGVPASITLAQGLLESRYGLSELAM